MNIDGGILLKTLVYRVLALVLSLIVSYWWFDDIYTSIGFTIVSFTLATIMYFSFEMFWENIIVKSSIYTIK